MINLQKNIYVYDVETDGLKEDVSKIHCLSIAWRDKRGRIMTKSTTDYDEMRKFFNNQNITRIGHNITLYDEVVGKKILGVDTLLSKNSIIDTLSLSWYLYPEYKKHGLEEWGEFFGTPKVEIKDWKNLTSEEYIKRCEQDVLINLKLWEKEKRDLEAIYIDKDKMIRFISYLQFKLDCVREQELMRLRLDIPHIESTLEIFKKEQERRINELKLVMPKVPIKKVKKYKEVIIDDKGDFHQKGDLMYEYFFKEGYRPKLNHEVETISGYNEPNPNSVPQKKDWLFSLGWKPQNIETKKNKKTGETSKIPKMNSKEDTGEICDSIKELYSIEPKLELLENLAVLQHRIGVLEGLLENQKEGYIEASMAGLTNTLRLKHKNIVNLPTEHKKYGKEVRASIIADYGCILCGSDMGGLEDNCKQHYIYPYDPKYVNEMRTPGFDAHLDIGIRAGLITVEESDWYKDYESKKDKMDFRPTKEDKAKYARIKKERDKSKKTNFAAVYGAGGPKIALTANINIKEGKLFHTIYWKRNAAVKLVAENAVVKEIGNKKWIYNPVSGFWHNLRAEKDRFSTLNSSTGVYCFDRYIYYMREQNIRIGLQYHDEILFNIIDKEEYKDNIRLSGKIAIKKVNDEVKLNVPLKISMDFGYDYAHCH